MKKFLTILSLICAFALTNCNNNDVNHPIVGHLYGAYTDSEYVLFLFNDNNTARIQMSTVSTGLVDSNHFTYNISGTIVYIYLDNSTYWKESVRGSLVYKLYYDSKNDILTESSTGLELTKIN